MRQRGQVGATVQSPSLPQPAMFGTPQDNTFDLVVSAAVLLCSLALLIGAATAPRWPRDGALIARRALAATVIGLPILLHLAAPSRSGIEGAARLIFIWVPVALGLLFFAIWHWRARTA